MSNYVIGLPVVVTVDMLGRVSYEVDLTEAVSAASEEYDMPYGDLTLIANDVTERGGFAHISALVGFAEGDAVVWTDPDGGMEHTGTLIDAHPEADVLSGGVMSTVECVGFADCPCRRCRTWRYLASVAHPAHVREGDRAYCEPCRRAAREARR